MHEANAVRTAIRNAQLERDTAIAAARAAGDHEAEGSFRHLELEIMDPTRATPEAVQLYASPILEELGLRSVSFDVFVRAVRCSLCGHLTHAEPAEPVCRSCGGPVPCTEGPAVEAHWTRPIAAPVGGPTHDGAQLADQHRHHVTRVVR
ncbi:MAG: hypothetical protein U0869_24515 [Chloroflexota bacterium]